MQCRSNCIFLTSKHVLDVSNSKVQANSRKLLASNMVENFRKEIQEVKSNIANSDKDLIIKNKRVSYSLKHYEAMSQYLDSKQSLSKMKPRIPGHYMLRKYSHPNTLHIIDGDVACNIFNAIKPHLQSSNKGYIYEVNAGYGLLTDELLKAQFPRLRIYEADSTLHKDLHILLLRSKSNAELFKSNLLMHWPKSGTKDADIYNDLPTFEWEDDPVIKVIVTIPSEKFLDHMMWCITHQTDVFNYGRFEMFVIMSPLVYLKFTSSQKDGYALYRFKSILFQILFEHTLLTKLPEKAFLPWVRKRKTKFTPPEEGVMYLVKVTPRQDLLQKVPLHLLLPLRFFVQTIMSKRKSSIIAAFEASWLTIGSTGDSHILCSIWLLLSHTRCPLAFTSTFSIETTFLMRKWVPGSGVRLIGQGMTIFTQCGTLTPDQVFKLFLQFTSWPEFESSAFLPSMGCNDEKNKLKYKKIWFSRRKEMLEESMYDSDDEGISDEISNYKSGDEKGS